MSWLSLIKKLQALSFCHVMLGRILRLTEMFEQIAFEKKMEIGGDKYSYRDKQDILKAFWRQRSGF